MLNRGFMTNQLSEPNQQTIAQFIKKHGIGVKSKLVVNAFDHADGDWRSSKHHYKVTFRRKGALPLTVDFWMGSAIANMGTPSEGPSGEDVLDCLITDIQCGWMSFEEYCSEFGVNSDSIKEQKLHMSCMKLVTKIYKFLGHELMKELEQCERL